MKHRSIPVLVAAVATLGVATGMSLAARPAGAAFDPKDFSGTWDRYSREPGAPNNIPVSTRIPDPPLKPQFVAPWKAERKKFADATAAGEPIATGYTHCQPDGMPAMMMAMVSTTKSLPSHLPTECPQKPGSASSIGGSVSFR